MRAAQAPAGLRRLKRLTLQVLGALLDMLDRRGVSPNTVSWISLIPAFLCAIAVASHQFVAAAALLALSGLCDLIDGALARRLERETRYGALLDSSLDRLSDAAPLAGLILVLGPHGMWASVPLVALLIGFSISYVRARAEGLAITLPWLWMRRTERLILTGFALLLAPINIDGLSVPMPLSLAMLLLVCVFGGIAFLQALRAASKVKN